MPTHFTDEELALIDRTLESIAMEQALVDRAVAAGLAPNRGAVISAAVRSWLSGHSEDAIVDSYRRRYADPAPEADELVRKLSAFSVAACLAACLAASDH